MERRQAMNGPPRPRRFAVSYADVKNALEKLFEEKGARYPQFYRGVTATEVCRWLREQHDSLDGARLWEFRPRVTRILKHGVETTREFRKDSIYERYKIRPQQ